MATPWLWPDREQYKEHRRMCHINYEQKRRQNLKSNFNDFQRLIPTVTHQLGVKNTKLDILAKGTDYIQQLQSERQQLSEETEMLKSQIESLNSEISHAQAQLPASGVPMPQAHVSKLKDMFGSYVREQTMANKKFWIFSLIAEPLLESYNRSVIATSDEDLRRSSLTWLDQQFLPDNLQPLVSSSLQKLTTTSITTPTTTTTANVITNTDGLSHELLLPPTSPCSSPYNFEPSPPHLEPVVMVSVLSPSSREVKSNTESEAAHLEEFQRVRHSNTEQKRRMNLKNIFETLRHLIPSINQNPKAKISNAAILQRGGEYIKELQSERQQLKEEAGKLKAEIQSLNCESSNAQTKMSVTGATTVDFSSSKLKEMFSTYVFEQTLASWKFYIFSLFAEPLLDSYNKSVTTSCHNHLRRSALAWLDQQCSLNALRSLVPSSMQKLTATTNVLAKPKNLRKEVTQRFKVHENKTKKTAKVNKKRTRKKKKLKKEEVEEELAEGE